MSLWKALDYLLRRRTYLLAFRCFQARPRRAADLSWLIPGLGLVTAAQLVHLLFRAGLLRRLEPEGPQRDSLLTLSVKGERLLGILLPELRRLDMLCRDSLSRTHQDNGRGGAWVIRRLLRQRGAMSLLAQLPDGLFAVDQFVYWAKSIPGASAVVCLHLLMQCGLIERIRHQSASHRDYRLTGLGRQTQLLLATLHTFADEIADRAVVHPSVFLAEAEPRTA